jgi:Na+/H+-dicarboxylate symporter
MQGDDKMSLTAKVLIGMGLGIIVGLVMNLSGMAAEDSFLGSKIIEFFAVVGKLFVNSLKMLVVPLVFFSLICGVCGIGDIRILGRVGGKAFALYMCTTAIAIATAIMLASLFGIGDGIEQSSAATFAAEEAPSLAQVIINIVPSNPVNAMANGDMLPIIFFTILIGISMLMVGDKAKPAVQAADIGNEIMMKMVTIIMAAAPYAVFCLIAKSIAILGFELLTSLAGYVLVLLGALLFHLFVTLMITLKVLTGLDPVVFLKKMRNVQVFAFSTASSNATIPVTMRTVTERIGVNNSVASFTVPFGATINMDGTAIMQGVATVFIANMYGVDLGLSGYLTVIFMSVLASIGTAGVPGVGLVMLSMVFTQVNLPVEGIGLLLGVDRLMDMVRTAVNVSGDAMVSTVVANSESKIDVDVFNDPQAGIFHEEEELHINKQSFGDEEQAG